MLRAETSRRRTPTRSARESWFDHGLLALALALSLIGYGSIIEGSDWWVTTLLVSVLIGLTCAVLRSIGTRWAAPVALVVEFVVLTWIFVPETLISIVPTAGTFSGLGDLVSQAQTIIVEEQAPVGAARPIVLVIAGAFGLLVIVGDLLLQSRWAAPLVGTLLLAVYATPALISGETPSGWLFLGLAALWLVLLRSRSTSSGLSATGSGPALALGSAALAAAVAFPVIAPDISAVAANWGKPPSSVFGRGINPMLELGQNLRRNSTQTSLTYTTTLDSPPYLKVATLRDFDGKSWKPTGDMGLGPAEGELAIYDQIKVEPASTTITIKQLRSSMLPVPYPASYDVRGLKGSWRFRTVGMTLTSNEDDSRGQVYTVSSLDRQPTANQMRSLDTFIGEPLKPYVKLPAKMPAIIADTARKVTASADNDYDRALALQDYLRTDGGFSYSETAPVADDYDGNGVDVIAKFLRAKSGYCVHFSSAMAVMARTLDIPARIAVGYAPGTSIGTRNGRTVYESTSDDLHAWTEIYFQGVGWVQFDPTTGIGSSTSFREPTSAPDDAPDEEAAPAPAPSQRPDTAAPQDTVAVTPADGSQTAPRTAFVTLAGLVLVGGLPWLVRTVRRRWRLRQGVSSVDPLWRELEDTARDLGIPVSTADTPRGFAGRLRASPGVDEASLDALLRRVETVRFARDADVPGDGVGDLVAVTASLRADASARQRVRATLLPRSLSGRAPVAPDDSAATLAT